MDIPISFNAGLLSQPIIPAWILMFEPTPSCVTYRNRRLTRRLRVVTGRVGRVVSMTLHAPKKKTPPSDEEKKSVYEALSQYA